MRALLLTLLTGKDNQSLDAGRVVMAVLAIALIGLEGHAVAWLHQAFDPVQFATGGGILLGAGCAGVAVKSHTEPGA